MADTPPAWRRLLDELALMRANLENVEYETVQVVREAGATWEEIGEALGISRQAARSRFTRPRVRRQRGS